MSSFHKQGFRSASVRMTSITENKDSLEKIQRHMKSYNATLGEMELVFKEYKEDADEKYVGYLGSQTNNIRKLAKELEDSGHPLEKICSKVSRDVEQYDIDSRRVREVLDEKYKQSKHSNKQKYDIERYPQKEAIAASELVTNQSQNDLNPELEIEENPNPKKPILLANDGSVVIPESEDSTEILDLRRLGKQAAQEIREDKQEAIDYSSKLTPTTHINKLTRDKKDLLIASLKSEVQQLRDDWQFEVDRNKKGLSDKLKTAEPIILQENESLKKEVQGLRTKLEEIDKEVIKQNDPLLQGYKDLEIAKLDAQRVTWLLKTSQQSQKTLFILINPKTDEIIHVKTDVDYHRILVRRQRVQEEELQQPQPQQQNKEEVSAS
ncbi:MAG: hypothetical protein L0H55_01000 [Candidatus Nitrosocosmicus sp.]|nr:hypothetical protein [Candidatus Nitrosocosmicus sp.]